MLAILHLLGTFVVNLFKSRRRLEIENLFLRHQLNIVLRRAPHRLRLRANDRALLVWMTWLWQASDFEEPYLRHLLGFIGITDVIFIHAEKTAFGPDGPVRPPSRPRRRASRPPGSAAIFGRPPREQDFQRQYRRKPARCQRTRVSGRMIVMALRTDGNHRYSWTKNKRSPFVSRTRPRTLTDLSARLIGDRLRADLRESFIVENRPGAATNIATASVARASNDGYTLLLSTNSNSMNVSLFKDLLFDLVRDLQPIAMIAVPRSAPTPAVDPGGRPPEQNRT